MKIRLIIYLLTFCFCFVLNAQQQAVSNDKVSGELFVDSDPVDAEVYINGVYLGQSPLFLPQLPVGDVYVECIKDDYQGATKVSISSYKAAKTMIKLQPVGKGLGNIYIKTKVDSNSNLFIDNVQTGTVGNGFIEEIPEGNHILEIKGAGTYAKKEISVKKNKTTQVDIVLEYFGVLQYKLPKNTTGIVKGQDFEQSISNEGSISKLNIGKYTIDVTGDEYQDFNMDVYIEKGSNIIFSPALKVKDTAALAIIEGDYWKLRTSMPSKIKSKKLLNITSWITIGIGIAAAGAAGYLYFQGNQAYTEYKAADLTNIDVRRNTLRTYDLWTTVSLIACGTTGGIGGALFLFAPNIENYEKQLKEMEEKIKGFGGNIKEPYTRPVEETKKVPVDETKPVGGDDTATLPNTEETSAADDQTATDDQTSPAVDNETPPVESETPVNSNE